MAEILTEQISSEQLRAQALANLLAALDGNKPAYTSEDLAATLSGSTRDSSPLGSTTEHQAASLIPPTAPAFGSPNLTLSIQIQQEQKAEPAIEPAAKPAVADWQALLASPAPLRPVLAAVEPRLVEKRRPARRSLRMRTARVAVAFAASLFGSHVVAPVVEDWTSSSSSGAVADRVADTVSMGVPVETPIPWTIVVPVVPETTTTVPAETTAPAPAPVSAEPATTTTLEATATTIAAPETTAEAPQLTLSQQIMAGEVTMAQRRGEALGMLRLNKYCDDVQVYINNSIDYTNLELVTNPAYASLLTEEARVKILYYHANQAAHAGQKLTLQAEAAYKAEQLRLEEDVQQYGLIGKDGNPPTGDPLYLLTPDFTPADPNCVPTAPNPRAERVVYGSTEANAIGNNGGKADALQPTAVVSEFGGLPGQGQVSLLAGHFSTISAAFNGLANNGLVNYELGDTVTYTVDGLSRTYAMVGRQEIDGNILMTTLMAQLNSEAGGKDRLVLQACVPNSNDRLFVLLDAVE